jgi:hypothetical protein
MIFQVQKYCMRETIARVCSTKPRLVPAVAARVRACCKLLNKEVSQRYYSCTYYSAYSEGETGTVQYNTYGTEPDGFEVCK